MPGIHDPSVALPVLIHGDAAFPGQGVVAETLNLQSLEGYATGGTLHLITNNQVGYTTDPAESRSTRYSSDLAKGFDVPIVHVNADDPEAALSAVRLALAYRTEFGHDFVIDLVGYRRFGHNEQDDASYTQPLMVERIQRQPTVRDVYAARLVEEGAHHRRRGRGARRRGHGDAARGARAAADGDRHGRASPGRRPGAAPARRRRATRSSRPSPPTGCARSTSSCSRCRTAFTINAKLAKQLERRHETIVEGGIDWGQGEALAYASLLEDGIPVRLSGQDTERGTFAHRHLVFHDPYTGETYAPIQHLPGANASFEVYNSPLSEYAALGFEYGYSVAAPDALVLWEAQFGDFVNGAQIVIDQFLVAGPLEVGSDLAADAAASARLRGERARALERAARALPPAGRAGQHPDRELHDGRAVLPSPPPPGARRDGATADRDDAEGPAPAQAGRRRRSRSSSTGSFRPVIPDPTRGSRRAPARSLQRQGLLRHRRPRRARRAPQTSRSRGSSSSIRSRSRPWPS